MKTKPNLDLKLADVTFIVYFVVGSRLVATALSNVLILARLLITASVSLVISCGVGLVALGATELIFWIDFLVEVIPSKLSVASTNDNI